MYGGGWPMMGGYGGYGMYGGGWPMMGGYGSYGRMWKAQPNLNTALLDDNTTTSVGSTTLPIELTPVSKHYGRYGGYGGYGGGGYGGYGGGYGGGGYGGYGRRYW